MQSHPNKLSLTNDIAQSHTRLNKVVNNLPKEPGIYGLIAVGGNGAFGLGKGLPWKNHKTDMSWFKTLTMGKKVAVSQKTFDTIPNSLPGRVVFIADRHGIKSQEGWPLNLNRLNEDIFFIGGKRAIQNNQEMFDGFYVTVIPGEYKHDVSFDINTIYDYGFKLDFIGGSKSKENYCYLLSFSRIDGINRHGRIIQEFFEPYLKLTLKEDVVIKPGAHGTAKINETVFTPRNQVGIFDVRKTLGDAGLYATANTFKREWVGTPTVTITNKSNVEIVLRKNEEIGEISFVSNQPF